MIKKKQTVLVISNLYHIPFIFLSYFITSLSSFFTVTTTLHLSSSLVNLEALTIHVHVHIDSVSIADIQLTTAYSKVTLNES